ncbi:MAG: hypothetical protein HY726_06825 [Candidatus Rokubacteria bacterium]|nr:hypothetical protein [Candidatus Rokubacteria bacterium]
MTAKRAGVVVLALAAAGLAVCALPWRARAQPEEGPPPLMVRELAVQGNRRVQEAVILQRIQTRLGAPFVRAQVAQDIRAVFALGFFDDVQVKVEEFEGGIKLTFVVVERPFIRDIAFEGNRRIATQTLQETIDLKPGLIYNPTDVERSRERLKDHYEQEGYFEAEITPEARALSDGDLRVVFGIVEGRRFTIDRIVIGGAKGLAARQIKAAMETRERRFFFFGGIVQRRSLERDLERIVALYHDHGYLHARVESHEITVDRARARVTITVNLIEGLQFTVGNVEVTGTRVLPVEEVRRQLKLAPGEVFSRSKLRESVSAITDLYGAIGRACAEVSVTLEILEGAQVIVERMRSPANC